jgi:hypothetical protein
LVIEGSTRHRLPGREARARQRYAFGTLVCPHLACVRLHDGFGDHQAQTVAWISKSISTAIELSEHEQDFVTGYGTDWSFNLIAENVDSLCPRE